MFARGDAEEGFNLCASRVGSCKLFDMDAGGPLRPSASIASFLIQSHDSSSTKLSDVDSGPNSSPHACNLNSLLTITQDRLIFKLRVYSPTPPHTHT